MELPAPSSRSRLARGGKSAFTAGTKVGVRRSSRARRNVEPTPPTGSEGRKATAKTSGPSATPELQQWGARGPRESLATYGSRIQAKMAEYEELGRKLRSLREDLRFARYQADHASTGKRQKFTAQVQALKIEVAEVEEAKRKISEGAGFLQEKLINDERFKERKYGAGCPQESSEEEEEEGGEEDGGESAVGSEMDATPSVCDPQPPQDSYPEPAQVALPSSDGETEESGEEELASGGLLQAIIQQESPTRMDNFAFGEDLGKDHLVKKRKKRQKVQETVTYVFRPFQQSEPAVKLVQTAGPPKLPDPVSVVKRGQKGGYSMASKMAEDAIEPASPIGLKVGSSGAAGPPQGGGGRVQAPGASYATVCSGSGSPGVAGTAGHFPVRGGSVQKNDMSVCLGGGPPSAVDITGAAGHSSVRGGSVRASGAKTSCSVGAAGHSPVRGESVRAPVPAAEPVQSGRPGDGVVGGAGVRSEGQPQAQAVTSPMEEEPSESTPATAKPAKKTLLKPAVLQVPASPGYVRQDASVGCEDDGCGSVVNEKSVGGSVSGVNDGGSSGGMDDKNCGVNGGPGSASGSGSAAPPVVTAPRSYAHVAAGGVPLSIQPRGSLAAAPPGGST